MVTTPQKRKTTRKPIIHVAPETSAKAAGLRHVCDDGPGITRKVTARSVRYLDPEGKPVRDRADLARIKSLAIPPAWSDVWICPHADGHLQATGRDARGRKQYRYHPSWRCVRDETKFGRMMAFADALPAIRKRVDRDLAQAGLSRTKVLAAVVRLLETTLIRVGNDEYARTNQSFGLTTMRDRHVTIEKGQLRFGFKGKSGVKHDIALGDPRLAKVVRDCRDLPGQELFQYLDDDGKPCDVNSADVNNYLQEAAGHAFTAKDFRTWAGTVLAAMALREFEAFDSEAQAKRNVLRAIEGVSKRLGNTPTVCRKCYIHPEVIESYLDGSMLNTLKQRAEAEIGKNLNTLRSEEAAVLGLLQQRLARTLDAAKA